MTKELRKATMNRSKLRNKFLKTTNEESRRRFNRQRNFCVSLPRKTKRRFFGNQTITLSLIIKSFGKLLVLSSQSKLFTKNPLFSIITTKLLVMMQLSEIFNYRFSKIVENLDIACNIATSDITDLVFNAIKKYENHASIKKSNFHER